jgi:squalene cyclase
MLKLRFNTVFQLTAGCYNYHTNLSHSKEVLLRYSTFLLAYQTRSYSFTSTLPDCSHCYRTKLHTTWQIRNRTTNKQVNAIVNEADTWRRIRITDITIIYNL